MAIVDLEVEEAWRLVSSDTDKSARPIDWESKLILIWININSSKHKGDSSRKLTPNPQSTTWIAFGPWENLILNPME